MDKLYLKSGSNNNCLTKEQLCNSIDECIKNDLNKVDVILLIKKLSYGELKSVILTNLSEKGLNNLNEFQTISLNSFKKLFKEDLYLRYFSLKIFKKSFFNINSEDYKILGDKLGLISLSDYQLENELVSILKINDIIYLNDLEKLSVVDFISIVNENLLLEYYFLQKGIYKSYIKKNEIEYFGKDIGLKSIDLNKYYEINVFLRDYNISTYNDLKAYGMEEIKSILWSIPVCRGILEGLGLVYLQDFREDYLKKFSRKIGIDQGVTQDFEYNEIKSINLINNRLKQNGIECKYSLKVNGLKGFKRIFKLNTIGSILYEKVNSFIKKNTGSTIVNLKFEDLDYIGTLLGLLELTEKEHKCKLISSLGGEENFKKLTRTQIKKGLWKNPHIRYFIDIKFSIRDVKILRVHHIEEVKKYVEEI